MTIRLSRRQTLAIAGGLALVGPSAPALAQAPATRNDSAELIRAFTGGRTPTPARVKIDAPEIAENGNTVPLTVSVESPMTAESFCQEVLVVADGNPRGGVCKFQFTVQSGVAEANIRVRLAETQNLIAIAKMNDGSLFMDTRNVKVTIGGCGG